MTVDEVKSKIEAMRSMVRMNIETMISMSKPDKENIELMRKFLDEIEALAEVHILKFADIITDNVAILNVYMTMLSYGLLCCDQAKEYYKASKSGEVGS